MKKQLIFVCSFLLVGGVFCNNVSAQEAIAQEEISEKQVGATDKDDFLYGLQEMVEQQIEPQDQQFFEQELQELLATTFILYTKTLNYHWNMTGPNFIALHKMLNDNYETLLKQIDRIAEHIRALGFFPIATATDFIAQSKIQEHPGLRPSEMDMLKELEAGHRVIIGQLNKLFDDATDLMYNSTTDLITGLALENEKIAWMLKSHYA